MTPKQRAALDRLRATLDDIDARTRCPDERPLVDVIAEHARAERDRFTRR